MLSNLNGFKNHKHYKYEISNIIAGRILFSLCLVALKRAGWFVFDGQMKALNLRIRRGYVLAS